MPKSYEKSNKLTRTRSNSFTRRNSISSHTDKEIFLDENDTEIFSGVGSEIVPSSIATFHHSHNFENEEEEDSRENKDKAVETVERQPANFTPARNDNISVVSRVNSIESGTRPNFKFFTFDEIENAQGVSSTLDDPLVDYDTDWNIAPTYVTIEDESRSHSEHQSIESDHLEYESNYRTRLLSSGSEESTSVSIKTDRDLYPNSQMHYQRFYIAEEDLVIGIAGYKTSQVKIILYRALNVLTLGLSYLILRWMPRYRINLYGKAEKLVNCDWVVVENEYGELSIIDVEKKKFNRDSSIVFNTRPRDDSDSDSFDNPIDETKIPVLTWFEYRYLKLIYNPLEDIFTTNTNWVDKSRWSSSSRIRRGLDEYDVEARKLIFGANSLDLKEKSIPELLVKEVLHPFYIFQIFSIVLWLLDNYYYYAFCIFFISLVTVTESLIETKQTMKKLREISKLNTYPYVRIKRNGFWKEVMLEDLVPGDLYELSDPNLISIPCDSILVSGDCIINESMLTGESVPVTKTAVSDEVLRKHLVSYESAFVTKNQISGSLSKSYLFSGTKIIRVRRSGDELDDNSISSSLKNEPALAIVIKTGFATTKGQLLRSMLFPKPVGFKFYRDSFKYIGFMALIAFVGFIYSIHNFLSLDLDNRTIILRAFDIITIVVPPALPATLTIGTNFAINRLKKNQIFCISPSKVNIGGKVDVFCFDKTGTLTEDGLDILGVHIAQKSKERNIVEFSPLFKDMNTVLSGHSDLSDLLPPGDKSHESQIEAKNSHYLYNFLMSLCTCHSLRVVDDECIGDPLDFKMFEFTKWCLEEEFECQTDASHKTIYPFVVMPSDESVITRNQANCTAIVKSYEFVSQLRRMSVVSKGLFTPDLTIYTKGAPEVILELCKPETLPENYEQILYKYTHDGYRVIGVASKALNCSFKSLTHKARNELECDLEFLGFIVFENRLKDLSKPTLNTLNDANIRTVMCTGDNILTAISVGRESGLIEPKTNIFVPRFEESEDGTVDSITWEDVNNPQLCLDSDTLEPVFEVVKHPIKYKLAVTGDVFRYILKNEELDGKSKFSEQYVEKLFIYADIFARMSPDEKHELVEQLQKLDYTVGFCGDGANDCGALKAADIGISLSEAEASVAAPFTSTNFEISCVLNVIKEGRASLVTSFSCFKYMSLYSAIQFISVSLLYKKGSNLGDFQFLWIDLFLILPIAIFMSWSKPFDRIVRKKPSANLVSSKVLIPMLGNILLLLLFQVFVWLKVRHEAWYIPPVPADDDAIQSSDNTVLFLFSNIQYISIAVVLTQGPPYREPSTKNVPFVFDILFSMVCSWGLMIVDPESGFGGLMQLTYLSQGFKLFLIMVSLINLAALWVFDKHVFMYINKLYSRLAHGPNRKSKKYFKRLLNEYSDITV